jgi:hypothetical protein
MDRLAAMGVIDSAFEGQRPWTRQECARLVKEAEPRLQDVDSSSWAQLAYRDLLQEFDPELNETIDTDFDARVESAYVNALGISGPPLTDGYHFGQTIVNNFGRPMGEGFNFQSGVATRFVAGPFAAYVRGEYQYGSAPMSLSPTVQEQILATDVGLVTLPPGSPFAVPPPTTANRFEVLEAYLSMNVKNNLLTFGKQSLWWGPEQAGPFLFSTNAQPIPMFRYSRNVPLMIPFVSKLLGPLDIQALLGQLNGYQYVTLGGPTQFFAVQSPIRPHPWIQGGKFTFKPTSNLEFGFSETTVFAGPGVGFNAHTFFNSYGIAGSVSSSNTFATEPGDRRSALDFSYRVPGIRNWLTIYADSFSEDEFSPIAYPRRSAWWLGIYMPKIPLVPKLQLRAEGGYTDLPGFVCCGTYYWNDHYNSGYTNFGNIIGNWVGRQGRGIQGTGTYWLSARNHVDLTFRKQAANPAFLGGGTLYDGQASTWFMLKPNLQLSGYLQYERWNFPLIATTMKSNVSLSMQLDFLPLGGMTAANLVRAFRH